MAEISTSGSQRGEGAAEEKGVAAAEEEGGEGVAAAEEAEAEEEAEVEADRIMPLVGGCSAPEPALQSLTMRGSSDECVS
jgi:hypothetical protein